VRRGSINYFGWKNANKALEWKNWGRYGARETEWWMWGRTGLPIKCLRRGAGVEWPLNRWWADVGAVSRQGKGI